MAINKFVKKREHSFVCNQNDIWHGIKSVKKAAVHVTKRGKPGLRNFTINQNLWPHISIGLSSTVKGMEIR